MGVVDKKRDVFGKIAALRTITEGYPKFSRSASLPSISNSTSSSDFLIDLIKSLVGFTELQSIVVNIITYGLTDIEVEIKKTLKKELKKLVSCGVDPSIPSYLDYTSTGVDIELKKVDFFNIMKVPPTSKYGGMLYDDIPAGTSSTDFNTMLYDVVQSQTEAKWGESTNGSNILAIDFDQVGVSVNNVINIKAAEGYSPTTSNKTLTDLNNDYIDSINLFGSQKMITNIVDSIFGSLSNAVEKSQEQLENEVKINTAFEDILNADDDAVIDDSYFEFNNEQMQKIEGDATNRRKGIIKLETCTSTQSTIPVDKLKEISDSLSGTCVGCEEERDAVNAAFDSMAADVSADEPDLKNKYAIKLNFIELMLKKLMSAIINFIISPKVVAIFVLNYKIVYGLDEDYEDGVDFMRKNKTLITNIAKSIRDEVLKVLLTRALKEVTTLVAEAAAKSATSKAKQQAAQLLSLVGVPQNIIRIISGLA